MTESLAGTYKLRFGAHNGVKRLEPGTEITLSHDDAFRHLVEDSVVAPEWLTAAQLATIAAAKLADARRRGRA